MFTVAMRKEKTPQYKELNVKQDLFCKIFATDPECLGNATYAYMKAYGATMITARPAASRMIDLPEITARINDYLEQDGFNNVSVDKKHNFLIKQNKDFGVSLKAIQEYNKLKKRVTNIVELTIPKPIIDLDDDEVIHKMDKKRAIDVSNSDTPTE